MPGIAILGAGGYIGRSLASALAAMPGDDLTLYSRAPASLRLPPTPRRHVAAAPIGDFTSACHDVVINAIGAGDPARIGTLGAELLTLTRLWDDRVIETLDPARETLYVFLSSGAVHGGDFASPAGGEGPVPVDASPPEPYVLAKREAEARHRAMPRSRIVDLRVFGFADAAIDPGGTSFLAEVARAVTHGMPLVTTRHDFVRDYAGSRELLRFIELCRAQPVLNRAFDVYTAAPIAKLALLDQLAARFGLAVDWRDAAPAPGVGGPKRRYYSLCRAAASIGYVPDRTSAEVVCSSLAAMPGSP